MSIRVALVAAFAFAAPTAIPSVASADETLSVSCSGGRQLAGGVTTCNTSATYQFLSSGPGQTYGLELTAPASHCSQVAYRVLAPGTRQLLGATGFLSAGESRLAEIGAGFAAGVTRVLIVADGRIGGCNAGRLGSWGVSVHPVLMR